MITYEELSNLKLEDVNESNIKKIKKVAHFKRNRLIEAGITGALCFFACCIPMFFGQTLDFFIAATGSFIIGSGLNFVINNSFDMMFSLRCGGLKIDEYQKLKESGKLAEIRRIVKQYKMTPMKKLSKLVVKKEKLEDKLTTINETIETAAHLINRTASNRMSTSYPKYIPPMEDVDENNDNIRLS